MKHLLPHGTIGVIYKDYRVYIGIMEKKMETTIILGLYRGYTYGWLLKLWSLFGYPKCKVPYDKKDPKRDHDFDNHPYELKSKLLKEGYIGDYMGDYYRGYLRGIPGV